MITIFNTIIFEPLYNALIFLTGIMPGHSVALAIIVLTLVVKLILSPLSYKSLVAQARTRKLQPKLNKIREQYKDNPQEQSAKTFELYREHKLNPFSGCVTLLLQLPVILALYRVFVRGFEQNPDLLYSFVAFPENLNLMFLGFIDMSGKSLILALCAGAAQFIQLRYALRNNEQPASGETSAGAQVQAMMTKHMQYVLPIIAVIFSYTISAAIALYWTTTSLFTLVQELIIRRKLRRDEEGDVIDVEHEVVAGNT